MGTYASTTALEVLMVGTTFDTATTALCSKMITHAENEVNKYISKRYDIAAIVADVPPIVTSWTETLAEGYMYQRMSRGGKESMERGQVLIDQVLKNLQLVMDYKADIPDGDGEVIPDMSNTSYRVQSSTDQYAPTFNEDNELNWRVDRDKLSDIKDERD